MMMLHPDQEAADLDERMSRVEFDRERLRRWHAEPLGAPPASTGPDMVPAAVMARRRERATRNECVERRAIPTDLDDHWIPDDEPSWRRFLPREG